MQFLAEAANPPDCSLNSASILNVRTWRLARSARPHSGQSVMIACRHEQDRVMKLEPVMSNCNSCRTPCMDFVQDHCRSLGVVVFVGVGSHSSSVF